MNNYCTDTGFLSLNKYGELLCGDHIETALDDENSEIIVLADGLGSGVKACILSTLTAKIISTMMANSMPMEECIKTVVSTLPICKERNIAYSTFTVIRIVDFHEAEIIQYDNPHVIMQRDGKNYEYPMSSEVIDGKQIYKSKIILQENDIFVALSDGVVHAGTGKSMNLSWQRKDIIEFLEDVYDGNFTAKTISSMLLNHCNELYGGMPSDDTTVCTVKIRKRQQINLLIGPPENPEDVSKMLSLFFSKEGKHIVCGGTTSHLVADFLKHPLEISKTLENTSDVPPISKIRGVDLVTEGAITINHVLMFARDYLNDNKKYTEWSYNKDGASLIACMLFEEATDINFYVGKAVNSANQNNGYNVKIHLVDELTGCLSAMGKKIKVSYF